MRRKKRVVRKRRQRGPAVKLGMSGHLPLKDWPAIAERLKADIRRSERLTGQDLMVRINCRG